MFLNKYLFSLFNVQVKYYRIKLLNYVVHLYFFRIKVYYFFLDDYYHNLEVWTKWILCDIKMFGLHIQI